MIVPVTLVTMAFVKMASIATTAFANRASLVRHKLMMQNQPSLNIFTNTL